MIMDAKTAIERIDDVLSSAIHYDESIEYQLTTDDVDWLEKAKEALEKQIPKKPMADISKIERQADFMEDAIYPLTIVEDRYGGAYSGGKYTAWNVGFDEIPPDIDSDDVWCHNFWNEQENNPTYFVGKGDTVSEALADLYIKLISAGIING